MTLDIFSGLRLIGIAAAISTPNLLCAQSPVENGASSEKAVPLVSETESAGSLLMRYSEMSVKINERPEIKALREKAEAAQAEYMSAFDKAAAEEDPKLLQEWKVFQGETQSGSRSGSAASRGYDSLSDDEKKRLADLTSQVVGDPAVKAARAARRDAKTDEERKSAQTEYRSAIRKAILEIDKSAEAIFNKMDGKAPAGSDDGTSE